MKMPRLYLGTMTFGWSQTSSKVDKAIAATMLERFMAHNHKMGVTQHRLDTARIYAGGKTEAIVGSILGQVDNAESVLVGTKAHPSRNGGLSAAGIEDQWKESMEAMNIGVVEEYYLHQPDTETSLEESLRTVNAYIEKGVVKVLGMSNYHASEVERAFELCAANNWAPPKVYQGLYNPLNRAAEEELLPLLRKHNCSFVAYNPLAAGLLTGKHISLDDVQKGRFQNNPNYLPRFYTPSNFEAVQIIRKACDESGISMVEATYRWLLCHSALQQEDGVLLGASSLHQLDQNLAACAMTDPLPTALLQAFDQAWEITRKAGVFPYWRSYSSDMPNREDLDQGASYSASSPKDTKTQDTDSQPAAAAARAAKLFTKTPLIKARALSEAVGRDVYLKLDNLQASGSFKDRGMAHLCHTLSTTKSVKRVISSSGGNAGLAVATVAPQLGLQVDVYVPETTKPLVVEKLRSLGANVTIHGENWNAADTLARQRVEEANRDEATAAYVSPYDNPLLWTGHSTVVDEILEDLSEAPGAIVVSVGGGGLLCGVLEGLARLKDGSRVKVVASETTGANCFAAALEAGHPVRLSAISSVATSLGALETTPVALERASSHGNVQSVVVSDSQAVQACLSFAADHRMLVEPACGTALAVAYSESLRENFLKDVEGPIVLVVCGGSGVSLDLLKQWEGDFLKMK